MPAPSTKAAASGAPSSIDPKPDDRPPFKVTNVKPRLIEIAGHRIPPLGSVIIPPEHEEGVRKSPPFLAKWLVEGDPVLPDSAPVNIGALDEVRAVKLVGIETDLAALSVWADTEKRPAVLEAIQARVKQL